MNNKYCQEHEENLIKKAPRLITLTNFSNHFQETELSLIYHYKKAQEDCLFLKSPTEEQEEIYIKNLEMIGHGKKIFFHHEKFSPYYDTFHFMFLWFGVEDEDMGFLERYLKRELAENFPFPSKQFINAALYSCAPPYNWVYSLSSGWQGPSFLRCIQKLFPEKETDGICKEKFVSIMQPKYITIEEGSVKKFDSKSIAEYLHEKTALNKNDVDKDFKAFYKIYKSRKKQIFKDLDKNFDPNIDTWVVDFGRFFEQQCSQWESEK